MTDYIVSCKFNSSSSSFYDYFMDEKFAVLNAPEKDDLVVIIAPSSGYTLVTVVDVRVAEVADKLKHKEVVAHVSLKAERERVKNEALAKVAKQKLDKMLKEQTDLDKYSSLVASNPEAKALLEELKKLGGL